MKKLFAMLLAAVLVLAMGTAAVAESTGKGSITIPNAAKGETYYIYKLFDATVTGAGENAKISYSGDIPADLEAYFEEDSAGNISATVDSVTSVMNAALQNWAKTATPTKTEEGTGSAIVFSDLEYGYYVITTATGAAISVDSTNPDVTVYDKNPNVPVDNLVKGVDNDDVNFGDTVTYTVSFKTSNYNGNGENAKKIISYTIQDTLPEFLSNVTVTSIIVDNDGNAETTDDQNTVIAQFDTNKTIELSWVDDNGNSLYSNGAKVTLTYTAVVTENAAIAGAGNTNTVTVTCKDVANGSSEGSEKAVISTYAIALKKVNTAGQPLAGATFQLPFFVKAAADEDGAYIYAGTEAGDGLVNTVTTSTTGEITIKGVKSGDYSITENEAPAGYNKLTAPVTVSAVKTTETTTNKTFYLDANGNEIAESTEDTVTVVYTNNNLAASAVVVVNKTGTELPSTGGIGTTVFYTVGGVLMLAAAVLLVAKKMTSSGR